MFANTRPKQAQFPPLPNSDGSLPPPIQPTPLTPRFVEPRDDFFQIPKVHVKSDDKQRRKFYNRLVKKRTLIERRWKKSTSLKAFLASFKSSVPPMIVTRLCNARLKTLIYHKKYTKAIDLFTEMSKEGSYTSPESYSSIISMYARKAYFADEKNTGKLKAIELYTEQEKKGFYPETRAFNAVFFAASKLNKDDKVTELIKNRIPELSKADDKTRMEKIEKILSVEKPALNSTSYTQIVEYYTRNKKAEQAIHFYEESKLYYPPTLVLSTHMIKMFVALGQSRRSLDLIEELAVRNLADVIIYNIWIEIFAQKGDHIKVMELFDQMHEHRITPDVETYNLVLDVCGARQERRKVEQLFAQMKPRRLFPDPLTYTALIAMYCTMDPEAAEQTYFQLRKYQLLPVTRTFNVMLEMLAKYRDETKTQLYLFEMEKLRVPRDAVTYQMVIMLYRNIFKRSKAIAVYNEMLADGFAPTARTEIMMKQIMYKMPDEDIVSHYKESLEKGTKISTESYNEAIARSESQLKVGNALADFGEMKEHGIPKDVDTFRMVMRLYLDVQQPAYVPDFFDIMKDEGVVPDTNVYNLAFTAFSELGLANEIIVNFRGMIEKGIKPDNETFDIILPFLAPRDPTVTIEFYDIMKATEDLPAETARVQNAMIEAFGALGRVEEAEFFYEKMKKQGIANSATRLHMMDVLRQAKLGEKLTTLTAPILSIE